MPTVLITGANRGIGLEFTRQYAADGWQVFAGARNLDSANDLKQLAKDAQQRVQLLTIDVTKAETIADAVARVGNSDIDILINCAGVYGSSRQQLGNLDYRAWTQVLDTNTLGPVRVTEAFLENVARSDRKWIITITSGMGSISDNTSGGFIAYRTSKAAVNMAMQTLSIDLGSRGICCLLMNPGWVKTRMGGPNARITPTESVSGMRKVIESLTPSQSGKFFSYDGREYAW